MGNHNTSDRVNKMTGILRSLTKDLSAYDHPIVFPKAIKLEVTFIQGYDDGFITNNKTVDISYVITRQTVRSAFGKDQAIQYWYEKRYDDNLCSLSVSISSSFVEHFIYDGRSDFDISCVYTNDIDESIVKVAAIFIYDGGEYG